MLKREDNTASKGLLGVPSLLHMDIPDAGSLPWTSGLEARTCTPEEALLLIGSRRRELLEWVISIALAVVIALLTRTYVAAIYTVEGNSMLPNLTTGERILALKWTPLNRGDIIIFRLPDDPRTSFVKRVIALPGDTVEIQSGRVLVNGLEQAETYLQGKRTEGSLAATLVKPEHYFVLGDNRGFSMDSRDPLVGQIPFSAVRGEGTYILWPLDRIRSLR